MEYNNIQPNTQSNLTYNSSFASNRALNIGQQQEEQAQAIPVPPLGNASDLSASSPVRSLQDYNTIRPIEIDSWDLPEYQPIHPKELGIEKQEDEVRNGDLLEISLKHAQDCERLGVFQRAEKNYKEALKYTESVEHYKLYADCLRSISASFQDKDKANIYREKAARAFYYLGELYAKQGALEAAQTACKTSCELALHEVPLQALVAVARQIGETGDIVNALEKLAEFYAGKGDIASAIQMLEEALQVEKSFTILQKLEVLCGQAGGDGSQLKVNEARIHQFELQISQDSKIISIYRGYARFLKDIGRHKEARAVKDRMDALLQQNLYNTEHLEQKIIKQKGKIGALKQTIQSQTEIIHCLQEQIQAHTSKTDAALEGLEERLEFSKITSLSLDNLTSHENYEHKDEDIIPLLHTNPHLKYLCLQSTRHLTNAVLAIIPERFENLEYLKLSRCHKMTLAGLSAMIDRLPRLRRLLYWGIDGTVEEHHQIINKLNAREIKHGSLN